MVMSDAYRIVTLFLRKARTSDNYAFYKRHKNKGLHDFDGNMLPTMLKRTHAIVAQKQPSIVRACQNAIFSRRPALVFHMNTKWLVKP